MRAVGAHLIFCDDTEHPTGTMPPELLKTINELMPLDLLYVPELKMLGSTTSEVLDRFWLLLDMGCHLVALDGTFNSLHCDIEFYKEAATLFAMAARDLERDAVLRQSEKLERAAAPKRERSKRKLSWTPAQAAEVRRLYKDTGCGYIRIAKATELSVSVVRSILGKKADYRPSQRGCEAPDKVAS